ncbi:Cof-type HAD-IIB family hydrolase [Bacillus marinisedimentorum]|uniref:Cof-type HAD-IIB family hydrolase n=1 Tax=Bacillus marinisedimentorum TaxID=1821260 RepID=UPI0008721300|nr:Cof-type HAD-IIB family hydrolase [Bacillus marinisedimentorum]
MDKHLIAVDLDGTLLTTEKTITDRTKQALHEAAAAGHHVVIATGRPVRASMPYYKELGLSTPMVNFNGAFVHHPGDKNWGIYHTPLQLKTARHIIESANDFDAKNILAEVVDDVYLHKYDKEFHAVFSMGNPKVTTGDLLKYLADDPTSILIHPHDHNVDEIREHLDTRHAEVIEHRKWGAPWHVIEIVRKGLNKAVGLKRIADHFNVPKDRIIAFGDEDNDLEMIEYAGHGVAMGNAIDALKNIANSVTAHNDEDGVALMLEEKLGIKTV